MLKRLEMTCFRKHENSTLEFSEGMHCLRGANESGKTTITEAIVYALFGSRSLRTSLAETVTWGKPESSLKVVLHLGDHVFTRSSRGAEVTKDGKVVVTGQNEVTAFAASLIGADASVAGKLMLSNQGNLRGSLEAGPKATALLIEELANFDLFDTLLEAMQAKLMLGSPNVLEESLRQAEVRLSDFALAKEPSEQERDATIATYEAERAESARQYEAVRSEIGAAEKVYDETRARAEAYARVLMDLASAQEDLVTTRKDREAAVREASIKVLDVEGIQKQIVDAESAGRRSEAYAWLSSYTPIQPWNGCRANLDGAIETHRDARRRIVDENHSLSSEVRVLEAGVQTSDTCKACGQKLPDAEEIHRRNDEAKAKIASIEAKIAENSASAERLHAVEVAMAAIARADTALQPHLIRHGEFLTIDDSTTPPMISWKGDLPGITQDVSDLKRLLKVAQEDQVKRQKAEARVEVLAGSIAKLEARVVALESAAESMPKVGEGEVGQAKVALDRARLSADLHKSNISTSDMQIRMARELFESQRAAYERSIKERDTLVAQVEQAKANISTLHFNNTLLKKVRAARPVIADKLWSMVLASVSTMFSTMRGERSVVTKGKEGFTVNGQEVASLSGSTLDLLGLAIRVALVRTFLPECPFLILDEPASACDDGRTAALIGFIASAGFQQIVLVTHENVSEAVSNHVIELEAT